MNNNPELGIYIHWPFCEKKCPYCDFNSHVQDNIDHSDWLKAYLNELRYYARETPKHIINSVFFGGGTPSLMKASVVGKILDEIQSLWACSKNIEITAEANPSSSESQHFKDFHRAGINRLSIGVQSLSNQSLMFLGRLHNAGDAINAIKNATEIFPRFSFDLIYALPGQTTKMWEKELKEATHLAQGHISLYQLTIEPGTDFYKKRVNAANETLGADLLAMKIEDLRWWIAKEDTITPLHGSNDGIRLETGDRLEHETVTASEVASHTVTAVKDLQIDRFQWLITKEDTTVAAHSSHSGVRGVYENNDESNVGVTGEYHVKWNGGAEGRVRRGGETGR